MPLSSFWQSAATFPIAISRYHCLFFILLTPHTSYILITLCFYLHLSNLLLYALGPSVVEYLLSSPPVHAFWVARQQTHIGGLKTQHHHDGSVHTQKYLYWYIYIYVSTYQLIRWYSIHDLLSSRSYNVGDHKKNHLFGGWYIQYIPPITMVMTSVPMGPQFLPIHPPGRWLFFSLTRMPFSGFDGISWSSCCFKDPKKLHRANACSCRANHGTLFGDFLWPLRWVYSNSLVYFNGDSMGLNGIYYLMGI